MQFPLFIKTTFLCSLIVALSACGGGGSGSKSTSVSTPASAVSSANPGAGNTPSSAAVSSASVLAVSSPVPVVISSAASQISAASSLSTTTSANSLTTLSSASSGAVVISSSMASSSVAIDTQPDTFSFASILNAAPNSTVQSAAITIAGINAATAISITGGQYAISNGAYSSAAATVVNGQTVTVQVAAPSGINLTTSATLTVGGVSATFSVTTRTDIAAPSVQIMFPTPVSMTNGNSVLVRGTAKDNLSEIASVKVNGIAATSTDGFANWQANVPLSLGINTLVVSTQDDVENTEQNAATISVKRTITLTESYDMTVDKTHNRVLLPDLVNRAVVAVDLSTGVRSVVSEESKSTYALWGPTRIKLDAASNRALLLDGYDMVAMDLTSGALSLFPTSSTSASENGHFSPGVMDIDAENHRALVVDTNVLKAVDLASGARTTLPNSSDSGNMNLLFFSDRIAHDPAHNRVFIIDEFGAESVPAIDLSTGLRTLLPHPNSIANIYKATDIAIDTANNRALIMYDETKIVAMDLTSGVRTLICDLKLERRSFTKSIIAVDSGKRAFVLDVSNDTLISVDLSSGEHKVLSGNPALSEVNPLSNPRSVSFDAVNNRVLVVNAGKRDAVSPSLMSVDVNSSIRTVLSDSTIPDAQNKLVQPGKMVLDSNKNRALIVDEVLKALVAIDLSSGSRTIFSNNSTPNTANAFPEWPNSIALDAAHNRALVSDSSGTVMAADLGSGAGTVLSSPTIPNALNPLKSSADIEIDVARNRALVATGTSLVAIDLSSGARTLARENFSAMALVLDNENSRAWFSTNSEIGSIDFPSGTSSTVSSGNIFNRLLHAPSLSVDNIKKRAFVAETERNAIVLVDLVTGERVYFSK
ncbi:MAG TPA: hypothetical protein VN030_07730 [Cellvibrio sp.]|nr:hypothetical protein [Cellvibrio sp.]